MEIFVITALVTGLIFGAICSGMARSRNRGAIRWFFLGFFLGLMGVIILALIGRGTKGMKQCGNCAEFVMQQARVCKHCNADI